MKRDKEHGTDDNYRQKNATSVTSNLRFKNGNATKGGLNAPGVLRLVGLK